MIEKVMLTICLVGLIAAGGCRRNEPLDEPMRKVSAPNVKAASRISAINVLKPEFSPVATSPRDTERSRKVLQALESVYTNCTVLQAQQFASQIDYLLPRVPDFQREEICRDYINLIMRFDFPLYEACQGDGNLLAWSNRLAVAFFLLERSWESAARCAIPFPVLDPPRYCRKAREEAARRRDTGDLEGASILECVTESFLRANDSESGFLKRIYDMFCNMADASPDYDPRGKRAYLDEIKRCLGRYPKWAEAILDVDQTKK